MGNKASGSCRQVHLGMKPKLKTAVQENIQIWFRSVLKVGENELERRTEGLGRVARRFLFAWSGNMRRCIKIARYNEKR